MAARILIVDDDPDIIKGLSLRLKSAGYETVAANDGMTATQVAVKFQPDLIILDIGMPGGDGHTVNGRLKTNPSTMGIPVIYATARDSQDDRKRASEGGALGYLIKPFNHQELLSLVARSLMRPLA